MSLSSLLTKISNVRGAFVAALRSKGVALASSATLHECASAIQSITIGTDVGSTTAEASDVLFGKVFYTSGGTLTSGTIPTVSAAIVSGAVVVPSGYIPSSQSFSIGKEFYQCVTVSGLPYYAVSGAEMSAVNGNYTETGITRGGHKVYSNGTVYLFFDSDTWQCWFLGSDYNSNDPINEAYYHQTYDTALPETDTWDNGAAPDPAPSVTLKDDLPKTWGGCKALQDPVTGAWTFSMTVTTGLTYAGFTPEIGLVYNADATVKADLYTTSAQ